MKRRLENILVTGGAGFIGSNFIHYIFRNTPFCGKIINVDKLTYAGNLENLVEIDNKYIGERYFFEKADICNFDKIKKIFEKYDVDTVVNFAAGGIATPADAALMMQLGAQTIFVGSGIFKSADPAPRARAIVKAALSFDDPKALAEISEGLGEPMKGLDIATMPEDERMANRGW